MAEYDTCLIDIHVFKLNEYFVELNAVYSSFKLKLTYNKIVLD